MQIKKDLETLVLDLEDVKEMVKPLFELPIGEEDEEWTPETSEQPDFGMEPGSAPTPKVLPPPDARKRSQSLEPQALTLEGKLLRLFHEEVRRKDPPVSGM